MITVTNTATSENLVKLADVKDSLGLSDSLHDVTLERFIARASSRIARYCGRTLTLQRYETFIPSYGGVNLQLPHRWIRTLFFLRDSTDTGVAEISSADYRVDANRGLINRDEGWPWSAQFEQNSLVMDPIPGAEYLRWYLDYSAGFIPADGKTSTWDGSTSTDSTVPLDLEEAAIELVKTSWLSRDRDVAVASERVGELSVSYHDSTARLSSMPASVIDILTQYRSIY